MASYRILNSRRKLPTRQERANNYYKQITLEGLSLRARDRDINLDAREKDNRDENKWVFARGKK